MIKKCKKSRPYLGIISIHPAPYRDPVFTLLDQRQVLDIEVATIKAMNIHHKKN